MFFEINNIDFSHLVSSLKVGYETLVSDNTNAAGDTVIDIINKKIKLSVGIRHTTDEEMESFLAATNDYVVNVGFRDPKTQSIITINTHIDTPEPDYYTIQPTRIIYKPMSLNFTQL